jgi:acetoin utilization protein AcuB
MPVVERGKLLGIATVTDVLDAEVRSAMAPTPERGAIAADAMTAYPFTVSPDTTLADAAALMVRRHVRHIPVVDGTSTIVGMLSERDVRRAIGDPVHYVETRLRLLAQTKVRDVMTAPAIVTAYDRPLAEIAKQFADDKLGALPIVDKFGALIGIVSYVDALRLLVAA